MAGPPNHSSSPTPRPALLVALAIVVVMAYANTFAVPYLLDDFATIPGNASLRDLTRFRDVLFPPSNVYSAGRPILNLSYALNYAVGGLAVGGYHLVNLAIHVGATFVLYGIVRRTLALPKFRARFGDTSTSIALIVAAMWALHPLQTVSVTYLSQRAESLMALFYLLTLYAFVRSLGAQSALWKAVSIGAATLGMATKEVMVTAPLIVFLFDGTCVAGTFREAWSLRWRYYLGLAATWIVLAALMLTAGLSHRAVGAEQGVHWFDYARIECRGIFHYVTSAIFPHRLIFDRGANLPVPTWTELLVPLSLLIALIVGTSVQLWRRRVAGFLGASFLLFLAPTSSVIPIAGQPIAENRMYLPLALVIVAVVLGTQLFGRRVLVPWIAAALTLGVLAHERNSQFGTSTAIWRDTVSKQPSNDRAWVYLAESLKAEGKMAEAVDSYSAALRHLPEIAELHNNFGVLLYNVGRPDDALLHLQTAVKLKPGYMDAYYNFGAVLFNTGNTARALECFLTYLKFNPGSVEAQNFAGLCLVRQNQFAAAVPYFQRAVQLDPNHAAARANLESTLARAK